MLCRPTSSFVDDVTFLHNGPMACHVYSYVVIEHHKHNIRDSNQILLSDKDRKYSLLVATGAKSANYDYLVARSVAIVCMLNR